MNPEQAAVETEIDEREAMRVIRSASSWLPRRRRTAEEKLRHAGPEMVELVIRTVKRGARNTRRRRQMLFILVPAFLMTVYLFTKLNPAGGIAALVFFGFFAACALALMPSGLHRHAMRALILLDDLRAVGPLLDGIRSSAIDSKPVMAALTRLLPDLEDGYYTLLNDRQREEIYRQLATGYSNKNADFVIAALKAVRAAEDTTALAYVRGLANWGLVWKDRRRVRDEARVCLAALEERSRRDRPANTLLRPAEALGEGSLLRPAHGSAEGADSLLRPTGDDDFIL